MFDMMVIGPATRDINIDYTGDRVEAVGGAVLFCAFAAKAAGASVFSAVKINSIDQDIIAAFQMPYQNIELLPSRNTTQMQNEYFTQDRERRRASCLKQSDEISLEEIPKIDVKLYHLAGLLYGDFPKALIPQLAQRGKVAVDVQGFLRHNENGTMVFRDWKDKKQCCPFVDYLKTDAAEAEILTSIKDRYAAAEVIHKWGVKEVFISHNTEMLIYDGAEFYTCPVKARNLSGRTGRGDSVFAAYLARRVAGDTIEDALLFATALVSLKMETPGPFLGNESDVFTYINHYYIEKRLV